MEVSISSRMQKFVEEKVKAGEYASAEEVVEAGLASLEQQEQTGDFAPGELDRLPAEGEKDIGEGDLVDGEQVFLESDQKGDRLA
jgi:putative addiction module CopG family antidote